MNCKPDLYPLKRATTDLWVVDGAIAGAVAEKKGRWGRGTGGAGVLTPQALWSRTWQLTCQS